MHHLQNAGLLGIKGEVVFGVRKVVSDNLVHAVSYADIDGIDAGVLNGDRLLPADRVTGLRQHFAGGAVNDILSGDMVGNAGGDAQFFIVLIAAYAHQVIALGIKEQAVKQCARAFFRRRLARLLPAVDLKQRVGLGFDVGVTSADGSHQPLILAQKINQLHVCAISQGTQNDSDRQLAGTVDPHPEAVV